MHRVAVIVLTFLGGVTIAGAVAVHRWGDAAIVAGRKLHPQRALLTTIARAERKAAPAVVWFGDSTLLGTSYPHYVARARFGPARPNLVLAAPGLDCWAHYQLLGRVLTRRPLVIVLIANLRVLRMEGTTRTFNDFAQAIPVEELPRTLTLPYSFRGMTAPKLALARLLDTPWGEETFFLAEGLRRNVQTAAWWAMLGPESPPRGRREQGLKFLRGNQNVAAAYDAPIGPATPLVRFCRAAVAHAHDHDAEVLVIVTPIPTEFLRRHRRYDSARLSARVAMLRREIEAAGGTLLDLHDALSRKHFRDNAGHFSAEGHARMAELVGPEVAARWLAARARQAAAAPDTP